MHQVAQWVGLTDGQAVIFAVFFGLCFAVFLATRRSPALSLIGYIISALGMGVIPAILTYKFYLEGGLSRAEMLWGFCMGALTGYLIHKATGRAKQLLASRARRQPIP